MFDVGGRMVTDDNNGQNNPADLNDAGWKALAHLYGAYFTGLILQVSLRLGAETAGAWSFRFFRRQHHEKFLSSFEKLGAQGLPDAVAAARYHFLSNRIGGVEVEYMYESERKAWVRFPHPRWVYNGTAICGAPREVGLGFINGWYGHNGVSLGNPRLGWVCTSEDTAADIGYAGYFYEYDRDLDDDERVRFAPDEAPPPFDAAAAPVLDAAIWTPERLSKARRNYALDYVKWGLVELIELVGPDAAAEIGCHTAALIGRQFYRDLQARLALARADDSAQGFAHFMALLAGAHGDSPIAPAVDGTFGQSGWRLVRDMSQLSPAATGILFDAWNELWRGCASVHNRFLTLETLARPQTAEDDIGWRISPTESAT